MENPWTLTGRRIEISRPAHDWERRGNPKVNEGPQLLIKNDKVMIVYSASGSWTDHYCLGLLTLEKGASPLNPRAWAKHTDPVFQSTSEVFGPGHASFTTSPDGKEDWIVYHAARQRGAGWKRDIRLQPFTWRSDDTPDFGTPVPPNHPVPVPSGE